MTCILATLASPRGGTLLSLGQTAVRGLHHPALPAIAAEVPNPLQIKVNHLTVQLLSSDSRRADMKNFVDSLATVAID